jgi:hypothetical protein
VFWRCIEPERVKLKLFDCSRYHVTQYPELLGGTVSLVMKVIVLQEGENAPSTLPGTGSSSKSGSTENWGFPWEGSPVRPVCLWIYPSNSQNGAKPQALQAPKSSAPHHDNKLVRLQRSHTLFHRVAGTRWERIVFTDKKLFMVEPVHNHQNGRSWSAEAPGPSSVIEHHQNQQAIMVWGSICPSARHPWLL